MNVQCPNCKRCDFVTTERYDPNATPNGGMIRCLLPYAIDWLTLSTTSASEMCCPECLAPLVVKGRLIVKAANVCDVCGKSFKTPLALSGHKRSHKKSSAGQS